MPNYENMLKLNQERLEKLRKQRQILKNMSVTTKSYSDKMAIESVLYEVGVEIDREMSLAKTYRKNIIKEKIGFPL